MIYKIVLLLMAIYSPLREINQELKAPRRPPLIRKIHLLQKRVRHSVSTGSQLADGQRIHSLQATYKRRLCSMCERRLKEPGVLNGFLAEPTDLYQVDWKAGIQQVKHLWQ